MRCGILALKNMRCEWYASYIHISWFCHTAQFCKSRKVQRAENYIRYRIRKNVTTWFSHDKNSHLFTRWREGKYPNANTQRVRYGIVLKTHQLPHGSKLSVPSSMRTVLVKYFTVLVKYRPIFQMIFSPVLTADKSNNTKWVRRGWQEAAARKRQSRQFSTLPTSGGNYQIPILRTEMSLTT